MKKLKRRDVEELEERIYSNRYSSALSYKKMIQPINRDIERYHIIYYQRL